MSLDYNNKSVPNLNFNLSGSASPIVQGTFQSAPSISTQWDFSITNNIESGISPSSFSYGSQHTYLKLDLGTSWTDIGGVNGIMGIYIQGTIQKVTNGSSQHAVSFEHFGIPIFLIYLNFKIGPIMASFREIYLPNGVLNL